MRNLFARQAIPMVWDYAEGNPLSDSTGNWMAHINWVWKVVARLPSRRAGFARQADAAQITTGAITLSTDPPYYDNIGYADLSDFFYVWLRRNLRDIYPAVFSTMLVPKVQELIASKHRHGNKDEAKEFFESGMLETFTNIRRFVQEDLPLTVYYAFKQQDAGFLRGSAQGEVASTGWETMLTSLVESGFSIVGTWPMRTERKGRTNAISTNSLASSIVLVCRPRPADARATSLRRFRNELRAELPAAIANMQSGSIAPVDLAQASIGPGMAIYSRYRQVLEADGRPLTVRDALVLINEALDKTLAEQDASLDSETRFAIGWFAQFRYTAGAFGEADVLARARNTSVQSVVLAGVATAAGGQVQLIHWRDYPEDYNPQEDARPTVWEGAHHLIKRLRSDGEVAAAALYNQLPSDIAGEAQNLAYRLYGICERQAWAEQALDYNALGSSWSEITRLAAQNRQQATQGEMF